MPSLLVPPLGTTQAAKVVSNLAAIPTNATDWVLIELRSAANLDVVIAQRAVFLLNDGSLLDPDGTIGAHFTQVAQSGSYYVLVRPHNHVALASAATLTYPNNYIDYTLAANVNGGASQLTTVATNTGATKAADANANGSVTFTEYNVCVTQLPQLVGYLSADFNLDGRVTIKDFDLYRSSAVAIGVTLVRY